MHGDIPLHLLGEPSAADRRSSRPEHIIRRHTEPGADAPPRLPGESVESFIRRYDEFRIAVGKAPACLQYVVQACRSAGFAAGMRGVTTNAIREHVRAVRAATASHAPGSRSQTETLIPRGSTPARAGGQVPAGDLTPRTSFAPRR
jgi:hypothetical protein